MRSRPIDPISVDLSVRIYQLLVSIYPSSFRLEYGSLMVQVFRDSCLQAFRQMSLIGLLSLWGRTLVDTLLSVIEQYSNRGAEMTRSNQLKMSSWIMVASSLLFFFGWLAGTRPEYDRYNFYSLPIDRVFNFISIPLIVLGILSAMVGILGLKRFFGDRAGLIGKAGLNISLIGGIVTIIGVIGMVVSSDGGSWWQISVVGVIGLFTGLFLFGIRCLQRKLFSRWNVLPLLTGIIWPMLWLYDALFIPNTGLGSGISDVVFSIVSIASFAGIGLVGYLLQSEIRKAQPEAV